MTELQSARLFLRNHMWRVLATHWECESYTECWTLSEEEAIAIVNALRTEYGPDTTIQIDPPKGA